jgi:hypothetical protein
MSELITLAVDVEPSPLDEQFGYFSPIGWIAPAEVTDPEPSPSDTGERIALADLIQAQITKFKSWNNEAGDLFAAHFEELASEAAFLGAHTAAEFHDHRAILLVD